MKRLMLLVLALVLLSTAVAQTKTPCSVMTLYGTYGVLEQGTIVTQIPGFPAPPPYPVVLAARAIYDGTGNLSGPFKISIAGLQLTGTFTGTYTVSSDCKYTEEFVATPPGASLHDSGVITGDGTSREIHYIYTDSDRVISGIARKTPPGGCSLKTVKGKYVVFGQGTLMVQPPIAAAHVGPLTADGAGHFSGRENVTFGGTALQDTFTGDYAVDPDCTFSNVVTDSIGNVVHEWGTITGEGRSQEFDGIQTDAGWVFAERVTRQ
jgi:hypothetical protein